MFLAGCGAAPQTVVPFDGLQVSVPQEYTSVSSAAIDGYQIINKILKAYKLDTRTLIVARSALNAKLSPQEYASTSKEKLAFAMPGYEHIDDGTSRFDCGDEEIVGYTHKFSIADSSWEENPGKTYVMQYYFIAQWTPYIISQADRSSSHYSDFTSLLNSLECR